MNKKIKTPKTRNCFFKNFSFLMPKIGISLYVCLGVALFFLPTPFFSLTKTEEAQEENRELIQKQNELILSKTNDYYNKGRYLKAVDEINLAIEYHQEENVIPDNIQLMAEASYYAWINSIYKNNKVPELNEFYDILSYLTLHPEVMSPRIKTLVDEMFQNEKNYYETLRIVNIEKDNRRELERIKNTVLKLESKKKLLDSVIANEVTVKDVKHSIELERQYNQSQRIKYIMLSLYFLIFVGIIILILVLYKKHKHTIEAQQQFETTMKVVAILQHKVDKESSPYQPNKEEDNAEKNKDLQVVKTKKRAGLTDYQSEKLAIEYFSNENANKDFIVLQNKCIELGEKIDKATGRIRNSKKVSELVFKLCKASGVDDKLALIYYCAAMVYDAGFLAISKNILQGEHLTIKERYEVRSHVQKASEYFGFIPENINKIFLDAAEFHHENMDGKGYLAGMSGKKIPLIARFIRVAESYISLVNTRSYKKIMDSDSALAELTKKSGIYDPKILSLLEKVI